MNLKTWLRIIILGITLTATISDKTRMILLLMRHGARNPTHSMNTFHISSERETYGDLTVTGMRNHYNLGSLIQKRFQSVIPTSQAKWSVDTSSYGRTVASAISNLTASASTVSPTTLNTSGQKKWWLPPNSSVASDLSTDSSLPANINMFPLDVKGDDTNYMFLGLKCAKISPLSDENMIKHSESLEGKIDASYQVFEKNGYDPKVLFEDQKWSVVNSFDLVDQILSKIFNDDKFDWNYELLLHSDYIHSINYFMLGQDDHVNKVSNTKLYESWLSKISRLEDFLKGKGDAVSDSVSVYSGHDVNIGMVSSHLLDNRAGYQCLVDNYDRLVARSSVGGKEDYDKAVESIAAAGCFKTVQYASNIVFEVYTPAASVSEGEAQSDSQSVLRLSTKIPELRVKVLYNGEPKPIDGKDSLSIAEFKSLLKRKKSANFNKDCGDEILQQKNTQKALKVLAVACLLVDAVLILMLAILGIGGLCAAKKSSDSQDDSEYTEIKSDNQHELDSEDGKSDQSEEEDEKKLMSDQKKTKSGSDE